MHISVRRETPRDWAATEAVVRDAFGRTEEAQLVSRMRSYPDVLSFVAIADGRHVGHAMFSPVTLPGTAVTPVACGLAPVAVRRTTQRRGVGVRMIRFGLQELRRRGVGLVVVLGHPSYYGRLGFVSGNPLGLCCKWGGEDGAFQVLELVPGTAVKYRGMVDYHPVFDEFAW